MRFLFVVVAGAIGWLWYAARAPAEAPPPPSPHIRQADLTSLGVQVAAARSAVIRIETPTEDEVDEPEVGEDELQVDEDELEVDEDELEVDEDEPDLADLAEQAQLAVFDRPPPSDAIDLSQHDDYGEVIVIQDSAPIIDQGMTSCGGVVLEGTYVANIPVVRTFEGALGTPNPGHTFGDDEPVSFSSGGLVANTYEPGSEPAIDQSAIDQPAIDDIPNEEIEVIGAPTGY